MIPLQDPDGFYFCLADSKDQSFIGLNSPIADFDLFSDSQN
jgi:hypothetical protein